MCGKSECECSRRCLQGRDVKGLYRKARAGEVKNYTGIDSPYEEPRNPELIIDTESRDLEDCASLLIAMLEDRCVTPSQCLSAAS